METIYNKYDNFLMNIQINEYPKAIQDKVKYLLQDGKRLRPILCLVFSNVGSIGDSNVGNVGDSNVGDSNDKKEKLIYTVASCIETIHCLSLVLDDLPEMDNDSMRRGRSSFHSKFGTDYTNFFIYYMFNKIGLSLDIVLDVDSNIDSNIDTTKQKKHKKNKNHTHTHTHSGGGEGEHEHICEESCSGSGSESDETCSIDDYDESSNSFIEELSDIDKDNLSIGDFENNNSSNLYYIKCEKMPVSLSLMEKLDCTLDDVLDDNYNMVETEWFSVFFQVAFGLSIAQKYFNFVHNDLHSSNVMFKRSPIKYLYYQIANNYYKIPTFGKITKIIDFARGTFKLGDRWVFSDQFKEDADACGQYDYPVDGSLKNCEHKPNPSFDLVRLGTTVIQRLDDLDKVRDFVEQITMDDFGTSLCYNEDEFQLYIDIAHNCHNAIPTDVMDRPEFERFKINKNKIPKGQYVFTY